VTKSHVKMQFTVCRVNQGARLTPPPEVSMLDGNLTHIEEYLESELRSAASPIAQVV
jgi:hypothetical protein